MKAGIYTDLSNEEYHADPAISSSGLKVLATSTPKHYKAYMEENQEEKTPAMKFGTAAHTFILENEKFDEQYHIAPEGVRLDKRSKDYQRIEEEAGGKEIIGWPDYQRLNRMYKEFMAHDKAPNLLKSGIVETSHFVEDPDTGLMIRARPDIWVKDGEQLFIDYKTCGVSLGYTSYENHSYGLRRDIQSAFHKRVLELSTGNTVQAVVHIAQETFPPYDLRCFRIKEEKIENGNVDVSIALEKLKECMDTGVYPGYDSDIIDLGLPVSADYRIY